MSMSTQTFQVDGMTCSHCVGAVTAEIAELAPDASIDIVLGGEGPSTLTVTGPTPLTAEQVADALDEAGGYTLHAGSVG
jgi:copper chaperone CopZ